MAEKETEKKKGVVIKVPRINPWVIVSGILAIALIAIILWTGSITGRVTGVTSTISANEAANKTIDYINKYLLQGQATATLVSVKEDNGLYNVKLSISGRTYDSYVTMDGKLFFPSVIDLTQIPEIAEEQPQAQFDAPDRDKPTAMLFVMSFCPYGQQAENAMIPVVDLLGDKASIEPHFIVSISGDTVNSLHGEYEAKEDMRQACIWKNYGQATFWNYVKYLNQNCNRNNLDTCWKDAAKEANVDVKKIEDCVTNEGLELMKAEETLSEKYGVTGSPTLIINDQRYSGARTSEAFKEAICSGFKTEPSECSQTLSASSSSTSSGGCA